MITTALFILAISFVCLLGYLIQRTEQRDRRKLENSLREQDAWLATLGADHHGQ